MTLTIFLGSMLLAMAIGIPISMSLLVCGVALMWHLDMFDAQILAQNLLGGADNYPLLLWAGLAVALGLGGLIVYQLMLLRRKLRERVFGAKLTMRLVALSRREGVRS